MNPVRSFGLLYGMLSVLMVLGVNPVTMSLLSSDGLAPDTVFKIYRLDAAWLACGLLCFGLARLAGRRPWTPPRPWMVNGFLLVSMLVFLTVALESALALKFPPNYDWRDTYDYSRVPLTLPDDFLGHALNPNSVTPYRINELGFRGRSMAVRKDENEIRILMTGDSNTFGWGLPDENTTYPARLQQRLDTLNDGRTFAVLNAGIPSYTSFQVLRLFQSRLLSFHPDILILCVGWNDLTMALMPDWSPDSALHRIPRDPYRVYHLFSPAILMAVREMSPIVYDLIHRVIPFRRIPDPRAVEAFRQNLIDIAGLARQHGIQLVFIQMPTVLSRTAMTLEELNKASPFVFPHRVSEAYVTDTERASLRHEIDTVAMFQAIIDTVGAQEQIPVIKEPSALFSLDESQKDAYFLDQCHPGDKGAALLADALFTWYLQRDRLAAQGVAP